MFNLAYKQTKTYNGYLINDTFDNVLRVFDLLNDNEINENLKLNLALKMFLGKDTPMVNEDLETQLEAFNDIFKMFSGEEKASGKVYDLAGNELPNYQADKQNYYSLVHDAEYIYASFMQAYKIDLIEEQGKLSWDKFQALLVGLPEDTKFRQVVSIRMWEAPSKTDNHTQQMKKLQEYYKLPD